MGAFAFLVKEAWPWAVNSSMTVERARCRREGCTGLYPAPALPDNGVTELSSGTHPVWVLTETSDGVSALTRLGGTQWFHQGQENTRCIKNTKRGLKLFLDLAIFGGMWEEMRQRWLVESTVAFLPLEGFPSVFFFFKYFFFLLFSCMCSPGHTGGFPLPWLGITNWQHSMSHQLASG